jgi:molybdopterin converting factor small subunit
VSVRVALPPILRNAAGGQRMLEAEGDTVATVLSDLATRHPALALHLADEAGVIRRNIVVLHDGVLVRAHEAAGHPVARDDELVLTNALAGG